MKQVHRGSIIHFLGDPNSADNQCYEYFSDGLMIIEDGLVRGLYDAAQGIKNLEPDVPVIEHLDSLIMPGFVDCHIHFPQTEVIAAYGEQLLQWLNKYTFPSEGKFKDKTHAKTMAEQFLNELLRKMKGKITRMLTNTTT